MGAAANSGWHRLQLKRTAEGSTADLGLGAWTAATDYVALDALLAIRSRRSRLATAAGVRPTA